MVKRHAATFLQLASELLVSGYAVRFAVAGTSMFPTIHDGDTVVVAPVDPTRIASGDIVLYRQLDRPIVHRVREIRRSADSASVLVVRGDATAECDAAVGLQQVLGRVVAVGAGERLPTDSGRWVGRQPLQAAVRRMARRIVTSLSH
jgi:signal peptidase I